MKKILLLFLCLILCACTDSSKESDIEKIMKENDYVIIDVRTKEEYDELHIKDSINIAYDEIDSSIDIDKDKIIFVYCKSGGRSSIAYNTLKELGYTVYDLGGIDQINLLKEK